VEFFNHIESFKGCDQEVIEEKAREIENGIQTNNQLMADKSWQRVYQQARSNLTEIIIAMLKYSIVKSRPNLQERKIKVSRILDDSTSVNGPIELLLRVVNAMPNPELWIGAMNLTIPTIIYKAWPYSWIPESRKLDIYRKKVNTLIPSLIENMDEGMLLKRLQVMVKFHTLLGQIKTMTNTDTQAVRAVEDSMIDMTRPRRLREPWMKPEDMEKEYLVISRKVKLDYEISNKNVYKGYRNPKGYNANTAPRTTGEKNDEVSKKRKEANTIKSVDNKKPKNDLSTVECYLCKQKGHIKRNCPKAKDTRSKASGDMDIDA
jgi:hypothetical protein